MVENAVSACWKGLCPERRAHQQNSSRIIRIPTDMWFNIFIYGYFICLWFGMLQVSGNL